MYNYKMKGYIKKKEREWYIVLCMCTSVWWRFVLYVSFFVVDHHCPCQVDDVIRSITSPDIYLLICLRRCRMRRSPSVLRRTGWPCSLNPAEETWLGFYPGSTVPAGHSHNNLSMMQAWLLAFHIFPLSTHLSIVSRRETKTVLRSSSSSSRRTFLNFNILGRGASE